VRRNNRNKADLHSRTADSHSCSTPASHVIGAVPVAVIRTNALPKSAPRAKPPSAGLHEYIRTRRDSVRRFIRTNHPCRAISRDKDKSIIGYTRNLGRFESLVFTLHALSSQLVSGFPASDPSPLAARLIRLAERQPREGHEIGQSKPHHDIRPEGHRTHR